MNGREETARKYEKNANDILERAPSYLRDFYRSISDLSHTTKFVYLRYVLEFLDYIELNYLMDVTNINFVKDIKPSMIKSYMSNMKDVGDSLKAAKMYGIKKFFDYCFDDFIIDVNPFNRIKIPKDKKEHKIIYLTDDEIKILLNNIISGVAYKRKTRYVQEWIIRDKAIAMLSLFLGLRVASVSELNIDDINLNENTVTIREKGGSERVLGYSNELKRDLLDWVTLRKKILIENNKYDVNALFISDRLDRISVKTIERMIISCSYNIDKKITPHKLRATCATILCEKTGNIQLAAYVLGHSNLKNTQRYAEVTNKTKERAVSVMSNILYEDTNN